LEEISNIPGVFAERLKAPGGAIGDADKELTRLSVINNSRFRPINHIQFTTDRPKSIYDP
jgi:hypothetical protein